MISLSASIRSVMQSAVYGLIRMHHVCSMEGLTATYEVESAALRGMEKSLEPSIITILGTVVFRMIWMVTVFKWIPTYDMLMNVYICFLGIYRWSDIHRVCIAYEKTGKRICGESRIEKEDAVQSAKTEEKRNTSWI